MTCDRIHIDQMESFSFLRVFDLILSQEQHGKLHEWVEIDVHSEFEAFNSVFLNSLALANRMIVNQNVHRAVFFGDALPRWFRLSNICKICLVEMDVFEVYMTCDSLGILDELWRQVIPDVNNYQIDTADLVSS